MKSVMFVTFGVLGWVWYELSGGDDFVPGQNGVQILASVQADRAAERAEPEVTRASMQASDLASVASVADAVVTRAKAVRMRPTDASIDPVIPADAAKFASLLDASERNTDVVTVAAEVLQQTPEGSDYRKVSGSRVNLREGPSTAYPVVTQLLRGEEVEVLDDSGDGWVRLRALDGDNVGWMSDSFLVAAN